MNRFLCIHGHFYQPPRENPWLEVIEPQESAAPYHDWNVRITDECYAPNAAARILDDRGRIRKIVNNYVDISFDYGPTLLAWLGRARPDVYRAIVDADGESARRHGGHGAAIAQAYHHLIQPLANGRDKRTQTIWGARDFEHRFGRRAAGMWLPETAVDLESLDVMAEQGIRFTILAPHQAGRVRALEGGEWRQPAGGPDPRRPYRVALPSGRAISVFFYDSPISRAVAFEDLLANGGRLAERLLAAANEAADGGPALLHIATDGETYGHHHAHGDMALAFAIDAIARCQDVQLTNYSEFLERRPPAEEVEILENTSWSCSHGVERWRADCGCVTGGRSGWNQSWRRPLREALDWLRDSLAAIYEEAGGALIDDPWRARDDYIEVVLDRREEVVDAFLERHRGGSLADWQRVRVLRLLEMQRHAMQMYTSCGWFFADLAGIETVQVLRYAARALELAEQVTGEPLEEPFLKRLQEAESNRPEEGDGRSVWNRHVLSARVDLRRLTAHYAIRSLFRPQEDRERLFLHTFTAHDRRTAESGRNRLALGRVDVVSTTTHESGVFTYGALRIGDHTVSCGVREYAGASAYTAFVEEAGAAFENDDVPEVLRLLDRHLGVPHYTLRSLLANERQAMLNTILQKTLDQVESSYRQIYEHHAPMLRFLRGLDLPVVDALQVAAGVVVNAELQRALEDDPPRLERFEELVDEARRSGLDIDAGTIGYVLQEALVREAERLSSAPTEIEPLRRLEGLLQVARNATLSTKLWKVQNLFYELVSGAWLAQRRRAEEGDESAAAWVERFRSVAELLRVRVD